MKHLQKSKPLYSSDFYKWAKNQEDIIKENPSLKKELNTIIEEAYSKSRKKAANETGIDLKKFTVNCPWSLKEIISNN